MTFYTRYFLLTRRYSYDANHYLLFGYMLERAALLKDYCKSKDTLSPASLYILRRRIGELTHRLIELQQLTVGKGPAGHPEVD